MNNIPSLFGSLVFNDEVMKSRLPKQAYVGLKRSIEQGTYLEIEIANVIAATMKEWAIEKGATHYTHWFQPMTGITAEKHDSFISPVENDKIIMEFSGKELVKGEPDASSFPSGGLRATSEARGYSVWDTSSFAFIRDNTLYIPTAFCSYGGEALDNKTPLLRSCEALNKQALRVLRLFGDDEVSRVIATTGLEQEYFLIDKAAYEKRTDLIVCGRTLFGARAPKGQELDDYYFGSIKPRVLEFMSELDHELWKLGVYAKTRHNEAAPCQHEIAPIFTAANLAVDHNQLIMDMAKTIAEKHDLVCLLHEKPFSGLNGSGKHNNWAMSTDTGHNLLEPGTTPYRNARFLLFLAATIKMVDDYQDLLRLCVSSAGNDHRLGGYEAPPAIVSIFLGDEYTAMLEAIESDASYEDKEAMLMEVGTNVLPQFPKDMADRNRTSPFAFTGNKFEFRMLGSSFSGAGPNVVLNSAMAHTLEQIVNELEGSEHFKRDLFALIRKILKNHKRIIFNGNNYSSEWVKEAEKRGLSNLKSTVDALPVQVAQKNIDMYIRQGVYNKNEIHSRYEIAVETYATTLHIEALTMSEMAKCEILPAAITYQNEVVSLVVGKKNVGIDCEAEMDIANNISTLTKTLYAAISELEQRVLEAKAIGDAYQNAVFYREHVLDAMDRLRLVADELETIMPKKYRPFPTYLELLHSV